MIINYFFDDDYGGGEMMMMITIAVKMMMMMMTTMVVKLMMVVTMYNVFVHHFAFPIQVTVVSSVGWCGPHIIVLLFKPNSNKET